MLHVLESWRPVPSGYAARSWWIVTGQARAGLSVPAALVTSRQALYDDRPPERPDGVPVEILAPSPIERFFRDTLPAPFARPYHVDGRVIERAVVAAARRHRSEIVHVHWSSAIGAAAARAAGRLGLPLVAEVRFDLAGAMGAQTFRGRAAVLEHVARRHFERHLGKAAVVVAASEALATLLRGNSPWLGPRLHVVPNGIDADFVARCDAARERAGEGTGGRAGERVVVGTTSKMLRYENLEALIALCATRPSLELLFVGDGPERARLERLASPLNAARADRVRFVGCVPAGEIPERLAEIDLFVVPRHDLAITRFASPIKVVEAMAAACAVVGTTVGDTVTLLEGGCGELVPPGDIGALGAAVDALIADPARRAELGADARARVVRDYEGAVLLDRYTAVYAAARAPAGRSGESVRDIGARSGGREAGP